MNKNNNFLQVNRPEYVYFKLTPSTSCKNEKTDSFANLINQMYLDFNKKIILEGKKLTINVTPKVGYYVYMEKGGTVGFYFIVPDEYRLQFQDKINSTWKGVTATRISRYEVPEFKETCTKYTMVYTKEDGLSLETNKTNNDLLSANLNVLDVLEDGDKVGIFYNFQPVNWYQQRAFGNKYNETIKKINNFKPVEKDKGSYKYILKVMITTLFNIADGVFNGLSLGSTKNESKDNFTNTELVLLRMMGKTYNNVSESTKRKGSQQVVKTQVIILSESEDKKREDLNAKTLSNSFNAIAGDNSMKSIKIKRKINMGKLIDSFDVVENKHTNIISALELSNFVAIPGKTLIEEKKLESINVVEKTVPEELQDGHIRLGESTYKGNKTEAYISNDNQLSNLPIGLLGQQGGGKTTLMENMCVDMNKAGESVFVLDFIKECELTENIKRNIPKEDIVEINLGDISGLQGLGYNEVKFSSDMSSLDILKIANVQSQQVMSLVDSINDKGDPLSPNMRRFLNAACFIAFVHPNQSLLNIESVLTDYRVRQEYIDMIPEELKNTLKSKITALQELDDRNKAGFVVGTSTKNIDGILARINLLKEDIMLEMMFEKDINDNVDFVKCMDEGKVVLIRIPESDFGTEYVKSTLVTYFMSKIWLSSQLRKVNKDSKRVNVICDEIFKSPVAMNLLNKILPQSRKFKLRMVLSFHYFKQIETIKSSFKAAGGSFMLLQGTEKNNFKALEEEFENLGYDIESLLNLKRYQSLNLIKVKNGYSAFITQLPKPVANKVELNNVIEVDFTTKEDEEIIEKAQ